MWFFKRAIFLLEKIERQNDLIIEQNARILKNQEKIMSAMTDLAAKVAAEDTVIASAVVLINGFGARLAAAGTDADALAALAADVNSQTNALASAVAANTPAAPSTNSPAPVSDPLANPSGDTPAPASTNTTATKGNTTPPVNQAPVGTGNPPTPSSVP